MVEAIPYVTPPDKRSAKAGYVMVKLDKLLELERSTGVSQPLSLKSPECRNEGMDERDEIAGLATVVIRLGQYYERDSEILDWIYKPHPQLNGLPAANLIRSGDIEPVLAILDRLDADAYL